MKLLVCHSSLTGLLLKLDKLVKQVSFSNADTHTHKHRKPPPQHLLTLETRPLIQRLNVANIPAGETHLAGIQDSRNYTTPPFYPPGFTPTLTINLILYPLRPIV